MPFSHYLPLTPFALSSCPKFFSGSPSLARLNQSKPRSHLSLSLAKGFCFALFFFFSYLRSASNSSPSRWKMCFLTACITFPFHQASFYSFSMKQIASSGKPSITHSRRLLNLPLAPLPRFCLCSLSHRLLFSVSLGNRCFSFYLWILGI